MDPHFFADPDPESQNNADPADPDPKHCLKYCISLNSLSSKEIIIGKGNVVLESFKNFPKLRRARNNLDKISNKKKIHFI